MNHLKSLFHLDPDIVFLNHGSFGATPRPVLDNYQEWQRRLERQPVHFIVNELLDHLSWARGKLSEYIHAHPNDIVFIPNATFGVNLVARSLSFGEGDEILTTNHEYGACENAWEFICRKRGASYLRQPIHLPVRSKKEVIEQFWEGVTRRTKLIFISHITSPTALRMPVEEICQRARQLGILTFIDGAHTPGQIPLDLEVIEADFYTGNCHKWMLSPKGSAFLYTRPEVQPLIEPLIVSWGWGENPEFTAGSKYLDNLQWWGTRDPSAYLTVPAAIQFQEEHNWSQIRMQCHKLAVETRRRINELTNLDPICPDSQDWFNQMFTARLPDIDDIQALKKQMYDEFHVEVPVIQWNNKKFIRVSFQGYNSQEDADALLAALESIFAKIV